MRQADAIIIGSGIIGLSLAIELNKRGLRVLVADKGEPGREASWAAGGMLADFPLEMAPALRNLASASARMYPEFVRELEDESRMKIDLRDKGAIVFRQISEADVGDAAGSARFVKGLDAATIAERFSLPPSEWDLELVLEIWSRYAGLTPMFLRERSVDPRELTAAAIAAAKHRGIEFSSGDAVFAVELADGKAAGVRTKRTRFSAGVVVNCAGAWAGQIGPIPLPTRPVKGQMLCVIMPKKESVRHAIRMPEVYLIPRSDGRLLIGATQEEAGFDKQTAPETIRRLHRAAMDAVPELSAARMLEAWAGLRPGTPDALPILGATPVPGYSVATGHFRDGILLAPVTGKVMGQVMCGESAAFDLNAFSMSRFEG